MNNDAFTHFEHGLTVRPADVVMVSIARREASDASYGIVLLNNGALLECAYEDAQELGKKLAQATGASASSQAPQSVSDGNAAT